MGSAISLTKKIRNRKCPKNKNMSEKGKKQKQKQHDVRPIFIYSKE